jgi:hypothetical protein
MIAIARTATCEWDAIEQEQQQAIQELKALLNEGVLLNPDFFLDTNTINGKTYYRRREKSVCGGKIQPGRCVAITEADYHFLSEQKKRGRDAKKLIAQLRKNQARMVQLAAEANQYFGLHFSPMPLDIEQLLLDLGLTRSVVDTLEQPNELPSSRLRFRDLDCQQIKGVWFQIDTKQTPKIFWEQRWHPIIPLKEGKLLLIGKIEGGYCIIAKEMEIRFYADLELPESYQQMIQVALAQRPKDAASLKS